MAIYKTSEWNGSEKNNYYWDEYRLEEDEIVNYRCHRQKFIDGNITDWKMEESVEGTWKLDDPDMPEWIKQYIEDNSSSYSQLLSN